MIDTYKIKKNTTQRKLSYSLNKDTDYTYALARILFIGLFVLSVLFSGQKASAATVITDSANLLTAKEAEQIRSQCEYILTQYDTSIYIVTSDKIGGQDDFEGYMEKIGNAADAPENMILLFISTKKNGHVYQIFGYGKAETFMTHDRCNKVMDRMQGDLKEKEYFSALETFCKEVRSYMGRDPKFDNIIFQALPQLIFSLLLSTLIIFFMVRNTSGRNTTTVQTYIDQENSRLLGRIDHFTHMTVSRVKKSNNNSSGSGGSGGGGRSHSSGSSHSF